MPSSMPTCQGSRWSSCIQRYARVRLATSGRSSLKRPRNSEQVSVPVLLADNCCASVPEVQHARQPSCAAFSGLCRFQWFFGLLSTCQGSSKLVTAPCSLQPCFRSAAHVCGAGDFCAPS